MINPPAKSADTRHPVEFILLMAAMAALDAFAVDGIMPALKLIGKELNAPTENHRQFVITAIFLGFAAGVLIYGFVSDIVGRRLPTVAGFILFILGSFVCIFAETFNLLLAGRVLQGFGAAGPYVLSVAIVRDLYQGREMARKLSLIMMVFIGVPMVAPFIGQGIMLISGWRSIFIAFIVFAAFTLVWFWLRQPETLPSNDRASWSLRSLIRASSEVLGSRQTLRYLVSLGAVSGAFITYLSTGSQIFQDIYGLGIYFPVTFAALASLFGVSSFFNAKLVPVLGCSLLVHRALSVIIVASVVFCLQYWIVGDGPSLISYLLYIAVIMCGFAFLFGNITSLALDPQGHIAGAASSLVNSFSTVIAIVVAYLIGSHLSTTVYPVVIGFAVCCTVAWLLNRPSLPPANAV